MRKVAILILLVLCRPIMAIEKIVILLGPPGAGKGTQSMALRESLGWPVYKAEFFMQDQGISDQTRESYDFHIKSNNQVKYFFKTGLMISSLAAIKSGNIILDSWPKYEASIGVLVRMVDPKNILVIELVAKDSLLIDRIGSRTHCTNCHISYGMGRPQLRKNICDFCERSTIARSHDNTDDFPHRLMRFRAKQPEFHRAFEVNNIKIYQVDAEKNAQEIHEEIIKIIRNKFEV